MGEKEREIKTFEIRFHYELIIQLILNLLEWHELCHFIIIGLGKENEENVYVWLEQSQNTAYILILTVFEKDSVELFQTHCMKENSGMKKERICWTLYNNNNNNNKYIHSIYFTFVSVFCWILLNYLKHLNPSQRSTDRPTHCSFVFFPFVLHFHTFYIELINFSLIF